jgi:hypothetical protein
MAILLVMMKWAHYQNMLLTDLAGVSIVKDQTAGHAEIYSGVK